MTGPKRIYRNVDIPLITDTRQMNELYKAVYWYLTNNKNNEIDYLHEPYLQFVYSTKLNGESVSTIKDYNIHKILSEKKIKLLMFKGHEIEYKYDKELMTIYTDAERKRENYKVSLSTYMYEYEQRDILEDFCNHCLTEYIKNLSSAKWVQHIYTNSGDDWKGSLSNNTRKIDTIILKKGLKDEIKNDLQLFLNSEEWYKERDIPYSRGYLFYGCPGTGKTSMIKGISLQCKRHIHYLMLNEVKSDSQLMNLLKKINYKETILVIEDIDAMIDIVKSRSVDDKKDSTNDDNDKKDDTQENKSKLTLSGLLNAIDGVFSCHGRILIMTTNHPEVLDEALIRPGRIDGKYLFDNCDKSQIIDLYKMFFNSLLNEKELENVKDKLYSPAHITSIFLRYRNKPLDAIHNLDADDAKIIIQKVK